MASAILVLLSVPLFGQIKIGNDLGLTANGNLSANYSGIYGDQIASSHGFGVGGTAAIGGYYYNPNFMSFNVNPYFNQSRANSDFASVSDASGVTLASSIFSGSHFPGNITYTKAYNSTGNYGIPGITNFDTNGNNQSFGVTWSALLPNLPTLTVGYQMGDSNYSLYGTNENGNSNFRSLFLNSTYSVKGFHLGGGISNGSSEALIPGIFVVGGQEQNSNSDNTTYNFNATHRLPWNGTFTSTVARSDVNSDYLGYSFNGTIDRAGASVGVRPTEKLSFSLGGDYTDNLSGSLYQAIVPSSSATTFASSSTTSNSTQTSSTPDSGAATVTSVTGLAGTQTEQSSHAWNLLFDTTYAFARNLQAQGIIERRMQTYLGVNFGSTMYGGGVTYTRQIMGGYLGSSFNLIDSTLDGSNQNSLGFNTTANYNRRIRAWQVGGYFNYAQNAQTLLVTYTTSYYNFSANVSRRLLGKFFWTGSAGGSRSGLTAQPGTTSSSESFSTSVGSNRLALSGTYAKSDGNSLASGGGLVQTPLPPIIPPTLLVMYGGESYSAAISGSPIHRLSFSVSYVNSRSNISNQGVASWNHFEEENAYFQYRFRQIGMTGGYTRLIQGFSASGLPAANVNSFSVGVYRWFNFF